MTQAPITSSVTTDINIFAMADEFVFIGAGITIGSEANSAMFSGQGGATFEIFGSVFSAALFAMGLTDLGNGAGYTVTIGASGSVVGIAQGILLDGAGNTVTNQGTLEGEGNGIDSMGAQFLLTNSGTITGHTGDAVLSSGAGGHIINYGLIQTLAADAASNGVDLSDSDTSMVVKLTNYGTISAAGGTAVRGDVDDVDKIWNFGTIDGGVLQGGGNDFLRNGGLINGSVDLGANNDLFRGSGGSVEGDIHGASGNDTILGGVSADSIFGDAGNDLLKGGGDDDKLTGGLGTDTLFGGAGNDSFAFNQIAESTADAHRDHIADFTIGEDVIDLSGIDAKVGVTGNQAFSFITGQFNAVKGELHAVNSGANSFVSGDVDGDGKADFSILVVGVHDLTASDFIL